ncbi:hypothetical protein ElyMa_001748600 [Elysia marginata]|uniref:Uncharacterized protein n=1 Tax=Elysia marginata TaxID=1093978 RepID=A0AAV4EAV9_9GAST|nr:hypothetical protein ElyMa_001748600 [Elysia marginata]
MRRPFPAHSEDCGEATPINILRVSTSATPSGYLLFSGITTNTVMGPTRTVRQPIDGDNNISTESRATQTENTESDDAIRVNFAITRKTQTRAKEKSKIQGPNQAPLVKRHSCLGKKEEDIFINRDDKYKVKQNNEILKPNNHRSNNLSQPNGSIYDKFQRVSTYRYKQSSNILQTQKYSKALNKPHKSISNSVETKDLNKTSDTLGTGLNPETKLEESKHFRIKDGPEVNPTSPDHDINQMIHQTIDKCTEKITAQSLATQECEALQMHSKEQENEEQICPLDQNDKLTPVQRTPLPLISWLETPSLERREIPVSLYSSMFEQTQHPLAPHSFPPAPRLLISPKHTCPEGLTSQDIIQGVCINPNNTMAKDAPAPEEDVPSHQEDNQGDPCTSQANHNVRRAKSAVVVSNLNASDTIRERKRPRTVHHALLPRPTTSSSISPRRSVSLELNIVSLGPNTQKSKLNSIDTKELEAEGKDPKSEVSLTPRLDTMEAIKRSYHRIQSAPPLTSGREGVRGNSTTTQVDGDRSPLIQPCSEDVKKFSSPYWRARSTYHKRVLTAKEADTSDANADGITDLKAKVEETGQLKGSLLRPLLYTSDSGQMRHSAGCPYKCKNCFRACLVSDDFAQRAQQKRREETGLETRQSSKKTDRSETGTRRMKSNSDGGSVNSRDRRLNAITIVQRALARSQPLFQRVYGAKGHPQIILPWPSYAWMDIKQTRADKEKDMVSRAGTIGQNNAASTTINK